MAPSPSQTPPPGGPARPRRRDRHGRGLRGPLAPTRVPLRRGRSDRFDDLVLAAVERLEPRWGEPLAHVEFAVEDVPPPPVPGAEPAVPLGRSHPAVPLGRSHPAAPPHAARIVLYRRPLEARSLGERDLGRLVAEVVVEQVADLFGRTPEEIDPGYPG